MKKLFLSHTEKDKPFVRQLAADLQSFGIPAWIDEAEIGFGQSLIKKIQDSIESVSLVIVVVSNNSLKSGWVEKELEMALTLEMEGRRNFVVPLVVDDSPPPLVLRGKKFIDCRTLRAFKLNVGAFAEQISDGYKPVFLTAGQAFDLIKSKCLLQGGIVAISQQGLTHILDLTGHMTLRNLIFRDAYFGASRFWVFEAFIPESNIIQTVAVIDGVPENIGDRAVSAWATPDQLEKVRMNMLSYNRETGETTSQVGYRVTDYVPAAVADQFPDSEMAYGRVAEQAPQIIEGLLKNYFQIMMFEYNQSIKDFTWTIQFFDFFSLMPVYVFVCDPSGRILVNQAIPENCAVNQATITWTTHPDTGEIVGRLAEKPVDLVMSRIARSHERR